MTKEEAKEKILDIVRNINDYLSMDECLEHITAAIDAITCEPEPKFKVGDRVRDRFGIKGKIASVGTEQQYFVVFENRDVQIISEDDLAEVEE